MLKIQHNENKKRKSQHKADFVSLAGAEGFEPSTNSFGDCCSTS